MIKDIEDLTINERLELAGIETTLKAKNKAGIRYRVFEKDGLCIKFVGTCFFDDVNNAVMAAFGVSI